MVKVKNASETRMRGGRVWESKSKVGETTQKSEVRVSFWEPNHQQKYQRSPFETIVLVRELMARPHSEHASVIGATWVLCLVSVGPMNLPMS